MLHLCTYAHKNFHQPLDISLQLTTLAPTQTQHDMAYEHKPNTGSLFNNKTENPSAPQLKGDAMIDGKMYKVSCWFNKAKDGSQYLNCKYEAKTDAPATASGTNTPTHAPNPWDSFNI